MKPAFQPTSASCFQALSIEAFRQDAATSRENADTLIKALGKAVVQDQVSQQKMRESFNEGFVKDLRAARGEASQLLLGIYERGQDDNSSDNETTVSEVSAAAKASNGANKTIYAVVKAKRRNDCDYSILI